YGYNQPFIDPLLNELDFGSFEGKTKQKLIQHFAEQWIHQPDSLSFGERVANLETRVQQFLYDYGGCRHILIFGHGSWIRALRAVIQYGDINYMNQWNIAN